MSSAASTPKLTAQEYLAIERDVEDKHEFYDGEMFAMGGASREHNLLVFNLGVTLGPQIRSRDCEAYLNDMRVHIALNNSCTYPDVVITCKKPRFEDETLDTLTNPQVVIEVLSKSTEQFDRGTKFEYYRSIDSLMEYVLVAQDRKHIDHFLRQSDGSWLMREASGDTGVIELPSIGCQLSLADIYAKVAIEGS